MESHSFQCASCKTLLRLRADKAGQNVRCQNCGAVSTVPTRSPPKPNDGADVDDDLAEGEQHEDTPSGGREAASMPESVPTARRKRARRRTSPERAAYLRSAPGWRKVRLGLILIALSMALNCLGAFLFFFIPQSWAPLNYLLQAMPLAGNLLCVFVPLKGVARNLVIANLGVIALGLGLTLVANRMSQRIVDESLARSQESQRAVHESIARSQERIKKATDSDEEKELRKKPRTFTRRLRRGTRTPPRRNGN